MSALCRRWNDRIAPHIVVVLLFLCPLPAWAQGAADPWTAYRGQPVLSINIDVDARFGDESNAPATRSPALEKRATVIDAKELAYLRSLIDIEPGYLLDPADVQMAIKRIYALGRYRNVEVHAQRYSGVVLLVFRVLPNFVLGELTLRGTETFDEDTLRRALKFRPGEEYFQHTPDDVAERARHFLAQRGYVSAVITSKAQPGNDFRVDVALEIAPGPQLTIDNMTFGENGNVPAIALLDLVASEVGGPLDREVLERDRKRLEEAFIGRGYLSAVVEEPQIFVQGTLVDIHFPISPGPRIQVTLRGNRRLSTDTLMTLWPERSGALRATTLDRFSAAIESRYERLGFGDSKVRHVLLRDKKARINRYVVVIDEGQPLQVEKITFAGNEHIPSEDLQSHVRAILTERLTRQDLFEQISPWESHRALAGDDSQTPPPPLDAHFHTPVAPQKRWVPSIYAEAGESIRQVYYGKGYLRARVSGPKVKRDGQNVSVGFVVEEGPRTIVESIRFQNNKRLEAAKLLELLEDPEKDNRLSLGQPLSATSIEISRIRIIDHYRSQGYIYARVFSERKISNDGRSASVVYRVEEGPQVRIRRVLLRGNRYTDEDVIRSKISLKPGDIYSTRAALEDRRDIMSLGVFSSATVGLVDEKTPAELKDVVAQVVERNRSRPGVSVGISTADGPRLELSLVRQNMFGSATTLSSSLKINRQIFFLLYGVYEDSMRERYRNFNATEQLTKGIERELRLGLRSRRFELNDVDIILRGDVFNIQDNAIPYSLDETSVVGGVELFFNKHLRASFEPRLFLSSLQCPELGEGVPTDISCASGAQLLRSRVIAEGLRSGIKLSPEIVFEMRDNPLSTRRGLVARAQASWVWGSSQAEQSAPFEPFAFTKYEASVAGFVPLPGNLTLSLQASAGHIVQVRGQGIPVNERFYLGGRYSLRGFVENTLIPEDECVQAHRQCAEGEGEIAQIPGVIPLTRGGNTFVLARTELWLPLGKNFAVDVFLDAGNLWVQPVSEATFTLRIGSGAGLRYDTPIGAVVLDFGFNPYPRTALGEEVGIQPYFYIDGAI